MEGTEAFVIKVVAEGLAEQAVHAIEYGSHHAVDAVVTLTTIWGVKEAYHHVSHGVAHVCHRVVLVVKMHVTMPKFRGRGQRKPVIHTIVVTVTDHHNDNRPPVDFKPAPKIWEWHDSNSGL